MAFGGGAAILNGYTSHNSQCCGYAQLPLLTNTAHGIGANYGASTVQLPLIQAKAIGGLQDLTDPVTEQLPLVTGWALPNADKLSSTVQLELKGNDRKGISTLGVNAYNENVLIQTRAQSLDWADNFQITPNVVHLEGGVSVGVGGGVDPADPHVYANISNDALIAGNIVYMLPSGNIALAQADDLPQAEAVGICIEGGAALASLKWTSDSKVTIPDWTSVAGAANLLEGKTYFLRNDAPGQISTIPPTTGYIVAVGTAVSDTTLDVEVRETIKI